MSRIEYLREQAARAERLSEGSFDPLTTERLKQAARDFRMQAEQLASQPHKLIGGGRWNQASPPGVFPA